MINQPLAQCACCSTAVHPDNRLCPMCNFPLQGSEKEQAYFIEQRGARKEEVRKLEDKAGWASLVFFVVAVFTLLSGLGVFLSQDRFITIFGIVFCVLLALAYVLIGVWTARNPVPAISMGLALLISMMLQHAFNNFRTFGADFIIKLVIIVVLVNALRNALEARKLKKAHKL